MFALRGRQHVDMHLDVRHNARDTVCDIVWRGVADQRARGVFHGAITVAPGADGADARLQTKNLLLSAQAEIDAQPVLEIYADEVKAATARRSASSTNARCSICARAALPQPRRAAC